MRIALVAALAACGGSHHGAGGDAGTDVICECDAVPPDTIGPFGAVTATVVDKTGAPQMGKHVVFIDAVGTVTDVVTDASGVAQAMVQSPASVTVVHVIVEPSPPNITTLTTLTAIEAGDQMTFDVDAFLQHSTPLDTASAGTFTVTYPSYAGAAGYTIYDPCGATPVSGTTKQLTIGRSCAAPTMDFMVVAVNNMGQLLAWTQIAGVTFTPGGSATISQQWFPLQQIVTTYTNPTTGVANVELDGYSPTMRGSRAFAAANTNGGMTTITLTMPMSFHLAMQSILNPCATGDPSCANAARQIITQVDIGSTSYAMDIGSQLIPWLGYPNFMPATTQITTQVQGNQPIDWFAVDMLYVRNNTDPYYWRLFAPQPLATMQFPTLPASATDATILPTDKMSATHAYACESDAINGYRDAVKNIYDAFGECAQSPDPMTKPFLKGTLHRFSQSN